MIFAAASDPPAPIPYACSQFFINVANNANLDWFSGGSSRHPVFGKITSGMDVVVAISKVKTTEDNPNEPIMMKKITIAGLTKEERARWKGDGKAAGKDGVEL